MKKKKEENIVASQQIQCCIVSIFGLKGLEVIISINLCGGKERHACRYATML